MRRNFGSAGALAAAGKAVGVTDGGATPASGATGAGAAVANCATTLH